jgi:hypothetical protein
LGWPLALITGVVFKATDYPSLWAPGEPNGTNDATGRYLVYSKAGLEDVPENFLLPGVVCMNDVNSYRVNVKTGKRLTYKLYCSDMNQLYKMLEI